MGEVGGFLRAFVSEKKSLEKDFEILEKIRTNLQKLKVVKLCDKQCNRESYIGCDCGWLLSNPKLVM